MIVICSEINSPTVFHGKRGLAAGLADVAGESRHERQTTLLGAIVIGQLRREVVGPGFINAPRSVRIALVSK